MKKQLTFTIAAILFFSLAGRSQDLTMNQIGVGYSYDQSTGMISNLYFDVMNIDNSNDVNWSFNVAALLSDPITPTTIYEADRTSISSLSASSSVPVSNWDIDLNSVSGLPAGSYRLGIHVDIDDDISETDETNNYYYISPMGNDLVFGSGSAGVDTESPVSDFKNYPNPVINLTYFNFTISEKAQTTLTIYDASGVEVAQLINSELAVGSHTIGYDVTNLRAGMYAYSLTANNKSITRKFIVSH